MCPEVALGSCFWVFQDFSGQRIVLEGQSGLGTGTSLHGLGRGAWTTGQQLLFVMLKFQGM